MTDVYLIRHAQCIGNIENRLTGKEDYDLTNEGKIQVQLLTEYLKKHKIRQNLFKPIKKNNKNNHTNSQGRKCSNTVK